MSTTWNPSDKAAAVTLSGSNQVATGGAGGDAGVRSVHSFTTEKIYFEVQTGSLSDFHLAAGVAAATWNTASGSAAFGTPTDGVGKYATASYIDYNGTQYDNPNVPSYFSSGNRIAFAFDGANARVAVNIFTGGSWSGWRGNGAADPVAGTGMIDVSATLGSAVVKYLAAVLGNGDNGTLRSATAEWTGTCPSGYGEINASVAPADESIWSQENDTDTAVRGHLREFIPYYEPYLYAYNTQNVLGATTVQPLQRMDDATFDVPWVQWLATVSRLGVAVYQQEWSAAPLSDDLGSTSEGAFSSDGIAAAAFTGAASAAGDLSSSGIATASFAGALTAAGVLSSSGVAAASFASSSTAAGAFGSVGAASTSFASSFIGSAPASFAIDGSSAASFVSPAIAAPSAGGGHGGGDLRRAGIELVEAIHERRRKDEARRASEEARRATQTAKDARSAPEATQAPSDAVTPLAPPPAASAILSAAGGAPLPGRFERAREHAARIAAQEDDDLAILLLLAA